MAMIQVGIYEQIRWLVPAVLWLLLAACNTTENPAPTCLPIVLSETVPISTPTSTALPTATPSRPVSTITPNPIPPTPVPANTRLPSPTADLIYPFTLAGLRADEYPGGTIEVRGILEETAAFTRSYIAYPSDGLMITGMMLEPAGPGPHPVVILLHGFIERDAYYTGADTSTAAAYYAANGYITLAPDLRSWGESDSGLSLFHTGLVRDVLNLISAVASLPNADPQRIVLWGHSMGGGMATKVLAVDDRPVAAVLYAPNSADDADLIARWGRGCLPGESMAPGDHCNPAEVIPADIAPDLLDAYLAAAADPLRLQATSPLYHLDLIQVPVQIHIGTEDGQELVETPTDWSAKLYEGLLAAGKPAEYHIYEGEGHAFIGAAWQLFLERSLAYFNSVL